MKNDFVSSCVNYFASRSVDDSMDVGASEVVAESFGIALSLFGVTVGLLLTTSALLK
jgi:voltage-gated potassium channel Kch